MEWAHQIAHDLGRVGGYLVPIALGLCLIAAPLFGGVFAANAIFQRAKFRFGRVCAYILGWAAGLLAALLVFLVLAPSFDAAGRAICVVAYEHACADDGGADDSN